MVQNLQNKLCPKSTKGNTRRFLMQELKNNYRKCKTVQAISKQGIASEDNYIIDGQQQMVSGMEY